MVGAARVMGGDEEAMVGEAMDKDLEGLSRPLKVSMRWWDADVGSN